MSTPVHPAFVDAHQMLPLPRFKTLPATRTSGKRCVWCGATATVPLGPRLSTHNGTLHRWNPRSCDPCTRREAARVYQLHIRSCARCAPRLYCEDARALHELSTASPVSRADEPIREG